MDFSSEALARKRFSKKAFGGLDELEVRDFLISLSDEISRLRAASRAKEKRVQELSRIIEESRARENILKESITAVQKVTQKMRADAEAQSDIILQSAREKKLAMIREAEASLQSIYDDIASLKRFYIQFKASLKASIKAHLEMIEKEAPAHLSLLGAVEKEESPDAPPDEGHAMSSAAPPQSALPSLDPHAASPPPPPPLQENPSAPAASSRGESGAYKDSEAKAAESLSKSLKSLSEDFL